MRVADPTPNPFALGKGARGSFSQSCFAANAMPSCCLSEASYSEAQESWERSALKCHFSVRAMPPVYGTREEDTCVLKRHTFATRSVDYSGSPSLKGRGWGLGLSALHIKSSFHSNRKLRGTPPPAGAEAFRLSPVAASENRSEDGRNRRAKFAPGFTLLELAVVLFLMGLMLLIAMPNVGGVGDAKLKSISRRLAGRATYLYDEASARKLVIQLVFDMDNNAYFVMTADPYAAEPAFFPDLSPAGARVTLPDTVRIRDVTVEGIGTLSRGTIATQFYPEGYVDATIVHLVDSKERVMTLGIDPLTGQVMIAKGDIRQTRSRYGQ